VTLPIFDLSVLTLPSYTRTHGPANLWMTDYERAMVLALLAHVRAETVVEIGVNEGHLACDVFKHLPIKEYIGVDLAPLSKHRMAIESQNGEAPGGNIARLVLGQERFRLICYERGSLDISALPECDAVIIDGDHSATTVQHDTLLAENAVRRGVIMWHDYLNIYCGVTSVLEGLAAMGRDIRWIENTNLAVELR